MTENEGGVGHKVPQRVCSILLRRVSRDVRDHFKAACAKQGKTMTAAIVEMMRSEIRKHKK